MGLQLKGYQNRAIEFGLEHPGHYQAIDMGLGKTAITLNILDSIDQPAIVFAPLFVALNTWPEEIRKWTPWKSYTILHGNDKLKNWKSKKDIYIINYEGLKWFFTKACHAGMRNMTWIFDESSRCKDPTTQRFKMLWHLEKTMSAWRMNLSGSPAPKGLHNLWSQYYLLDGGRRLGKTHGSFVQSMFQVGQPPMCKLTPLPGTDTKIYRSIAPITFRLDKKDYLNIPPMVVNDILVELPPRLMDTYRDIEMNFFYEIAEQGLTIANAAVLSAKLRQFLQGGMYYGERGKYEMIHYEKMYMLRDLLYGLEGKPVLIPIQFRFEHMELTKIIGKFHTLVGGQKKAYTQQVIRRFNAGTISKVVTHPAAAAFGLNLQKSCHNIVWEALPWSTELYQQMNGRLHRMGQTKPVVVSRIIFKGTVDEVVARTIRDDTRTQNQLLDAVKRYMAERG